MCIRICICIIHTHTCDMDIYTYIQEAIHASRINKSVANTNTVRKNLHIFLPLIISWQRVFPEVSSERASLKRLLFSEYCNFK